MSCCQSPTQMFTMHINRHTCASKLAFFTTCVTSLPSARSCIWLARCLRDGALCVRMWLHSTRVCTSQSMCPTGATCHQITTCVKTHTYLPLKASRRNSSLKGTTRRKRLKQDICMTPCLMQTEINSNKDLLA